MKTNENKWTAMKKQYLFQASYMCVHTIETCIYVLQPFQLTSIECFKNFVQIATKRASPRGNQGQTADAADPGFIVFKDELDTDAELRTPNAD